MCRTSSVCIWALFTILTHLPFWSASAIVQKPAQEPAKKSGAAEARPEPFVAEGRLKIKLSSAEMTIAVPNKVPLDLHGHATKLIMVDWTPGIEGQNSSEPEELRLEHSPDGSSYVNVTPIRLGKRQLTLRVLFEDGGFDIASVDVDVNRLPDKAPRRLILADPAVTFNVTRKAGTLHLPLSPPADTQWLVPVVFYWEKDTPIALNPIPAVLLKEVVFTIIPRKDQPSPIEFEPSTGEIRPVKPGQVLVKVTFHGKSAYACVDVMKVADDWNSRATCMDFLPPSVNGMTIEDPMELSKPVQPSPQ